ncbi:conserved hypothetical protein [Gammaproteobacteria bacterium]
MSRTRVVSYVDDEILKSLNGLCENNDKPLSQIISELIDIGYRVKQHHEAHSDQREEDKKAELVDNHTEYLLKIMAITTDTYRCVRNEKSKYDDDSFDSVLTTINNKAQNFINRKLGNG